jgi:hypothetical protein
MLKVKTAGNIIANCVFHGVKVIDTYSYVLLINLDGTTFIQRINADSSEALYAHKSSSVSLATFWASPASQTYKCINDL